MTPSQDGTKLSERYPQEFTQWVQAGGIENNFHAHLLGIGKLQPSLADLALVAGQLQASAQQFALVANHLARG